MSLRRHGSPAIAVLVPLFCLLVAGAANEEGPEPPLLSSEHDGVAFPIQPPPTPDPAPSSAETIFETEGRNPGSAAHPGAPGRVRADAPAQHELGRRGLPAVHSEPRPLPPIDPHFHDALRLTDDFRNDDFPAIASNPRDREEVWAAWSSYSGRQERIHLSRRDPTTGQWAAWNAVPGVTGDVWRPSLGYDGQGRLWVIWAQQKLFDANFDLYARSFDGSEWGPLQRLTTAGEGDFNQSVAQGPDGTLHVAWQGFRRGQSDIFYIAHDGDRWSDPIAVTQSEENDWEPSIGVSARGVVFIAWDTYRDDSYDVLMRSLDGERLGPVRAVAESALYEARASLVVDGRDRVWVAHEVGEEGWGKDQGRLVDPDRAPGSTLGMERQVQVVVLDRESRIQAAKPEVASRFPPRLWKGMVETDNPHLSVPLLALDGRGRVNLFVRKQEYWGGSAEVFQSYVLTMTGEGWTSPRLLPWSVGRLSMFAAATPAAPGGLWVAWPRDNRPTFATSINLPEETVVENVYAARYDPEVDTTPGDALGPPEAPDFASRPPGHRDEAGDVARIRAWRARVGGRDLQILRGDTHRHTELSQDVGAIPDGSILDFYRYMLDAAALDWGLITDHQNGADREYWWWLEEKLADMFHAPERYVAMFGYERSATFPDGHRNVIHARRGVPPVPFFQRVDAPFRRHNNSTDVSTDDTRLLYESVRESGGVTIPHTSATEMGTDWRDNDPEVEPVVEIFQGHRHSYEGKDRPLANLLMDSRGGGARDDYEQGYVANAWAKGYRLGVIASSDHVSTHISYAMVWAEDRSREAVLEAIRRRRTYGATDNIILELWAGDHFMGEELEATAVPPLRVRAVGTRPFHRVEIIRNNESIYQNAGGTAELDLSHQDLSAPRGSSFYYVRVEQVDGQTAWSSPIWVDLE